MVILGFLGCFGSFASLDDVNVTPASGGVSEANVANVNVSRGESTGGQGKESIMAPMTEGAVELWGKESWEEKVAKWLFCGDERNTREVFVGGRCVHVRS